MKQLNKIVSSSQSSHLDHKAIESKWQERWKKEKIYQPIIANSKKKFYNLMMFPYPSAEGLHVGNMYAFTGADIYGRFQRMQGHDVLEPIGLDGFGIHSENYAIKVGRTPQEHATISEKNFYRQLSQIGNGFAWDNKVETYDPDYYRWTQWLFTELFKAGLAHRKKAAVNWCPSCKTVLADEQVIDGACERCSNIVEKKELEQWFFKITDYAERLLQNIEKLDWSEKVRVAQRNWIGKKEGATITWQVANGKWQIETFTTRPDTLYGATFLVLAPEHELVGKLTTKEQKGAVEAYIAEVKNKAEIDRVAEGKEKTGVFTGSFVAHPLTGDAVPVWIADYVLSSYGTGAIMAVPAHDERDFAFAKKYQLPIVQVIEGDEKTAISEAAYTGEGHIIDSGEWNGWKTPIAIGKVIASLEAKGVAKGQANYHLRDWLISRQRYWGPPIPMVYCQACHDKGQSWFTTEEGKRVKGQGESDQRISNFKFQISNSAASAAVGWYPVSDDQLPVLLPELENWKPTGTGKSPLASAETWVKTTCPGCGGEARRETDVSDTFLDSSWYFLRYPSVGRGSVSKDNKDDQKMEDGKWSTQMRDPAVAGKMENPWDSQITKAWLPVDQYIGGAEHSVLHLLYSRFVTMVLHDLGYLEFEEPFSKFFAHGLIIKDGAKMSKSKGNVVVPDEYIQKFGADTLRSYLMFIGPFSQGGDFQDTGIEGMNRFMKRVWKWITESNLSDRALTEDEQSFMHRSIKDITEEIGNLRYNTAIAKLMSYYNYFSKSDTLSTEVVSNFLRLFAPFAPHVTEELWERIGKSFSIHRTDWPTYEKSYFHEAHVNIAVQINGKLRDTLQVQSAKSKVQSEVEALAKASTKVQKFMEGKKIIKVVYIEGKVINFVTG